MAERDIIINSDDFPGNSNKSKEVVEKPKFEKVVESTVVKSKPSFFHKAIGAFFSDAETGEDLKSTIIFDYLIPTMKDTVFEIGKMLMEGILYGTASPHSTKSGTNKPYYTSYSQSSSDKNRKTTHNNDDRVTSRNFYDFLFTNPDGDRRKARYDAEKVLDQMIDAAHEYKTASVADFCEFAGIDQEFTDNDYGWTPEDLVKRTSIVGSGKGYKIVFPDPKPIPKD